MLRAWSAFGSGLNVGCFNNDVVEKTFHNSPRGILRVKTKCTFAGEGLKPGVNKILWRKENFACVRIFHWGSRRKTEDLDVTGIRRERTGN